MVFSPAAVSFADTLAAAVHYSSVKLVVAAVGGLHRFVTADPYLDVHLLEVLLTVELLGKQCYWMCSFFVLAMDAGAIGTG